MDGSVARGGCRIELEGKVPAGIYRIEDGTAKFKIPPKLALYRQLSYQRKYRALPHCEY